MESVLRLQLRHNIQFTLGIISTPSGCWTVVYTGVHRDQWARLQGIHSTGRLTADEQVCGCRTTQMSAVRQFSLGRSHRRSMPAVQDGITPSLYVVVNDRQLPGSHNALVRYLRFGTAMQAVGARWYKRRLMAPPTCQALTERYVIDKEHDSQRVRTRVDSGDGAMHLSRCTVNSITQFRPKCKLVKLQDLVDDSV